MLDETSRVKNLKWMWSVWKICFSNISHIPDRGFPCLCQTVKAFGFICAQLNHKRNRQDAHFCYWFSSSKHGKCVGVENIWGTEFVLQ